MSKKHTIVLFISIIIIILLYSLMGGGGAKTDLDIGEDALSISYKDFSMSIDYDNVTAIEAVELSDFGTAVTGGEDKACRWGVWESESLGEYSQYTILGTSNAILLHLHDGSKALLSYESGDTTVMLAQLLFDMLTEHGYNVDYIA